MLPFTGRSAAPES